MKLAFSCLPNGSLPYTNASAATKMMVKLFEKNPYLPMFPLADKQDNLIYRTLQNIPAISIRDNEVYIDNRSEQFSATISIMDDAYSSLDKTKVGAFCSKSFFLDKYFAMLS